MPQANAFPLDMPDDNPLSFKKWQDRMSELLDYTTNFGGVTDDDTLTNLGTIQLDDNSTYLIESWVLGGAAATDGTEILLGAQLNVFRGGFKLNSSGDASVIGAGVSKIYSGVNYQDTAEFWTANMAVSTNQVIQQVTGAVGDTVVWRCRMKIFIAEL